VTGAMLPGGSRQRAPGRPARSGTG